MRLLLLRLFSLRASPRIGRYQTVLLGSRECAAAFQNLIYRRWLQLATLSRPASGCHGNQVAARWSTELVSCTWTRRVRQPKGGSDRLSGRLRRHRRIKRTDSAEAPTNIKFTFSPDWSPERRTSFALKCRASTSSNTRPTSLVKRVSFACSWSISVHFCLLLSHRSNQFHYHLTDLS